MKKIIMMFAFVGMLVLASCSSGPEGTISKIEEKIKKQNELAKEKGYQGKETVLNYMELQQMIQDAEMEAGAQDSKWTNEQQEKLFKVTQTPILGEESTKEAVARQKGESSSSSSSSSSSDYSGGSYGNMPDQNSLGGLDEAQAPEF